MSSVRSLFILFAIALSGCSTLGTSKVQPLSDEMVQAHKGDIDAVWNDWVKREGCQPAGDRSGYEYDACVIPFDSSSAGNIKATERTIIDGFKRVCEASSARTFVIDQDGGKYLECTDSTTSESFASVKTRPDRSGLSVYMESPRRSAEHARIRQEQQAAQEKADDEYRYKLLANPSALGIDSLVRLISRFKDDDPKNLIPAAQKRLDELNAVADRQAKLAQEQSAKRVAEARTKQEHRSTGDQVCHLGSDVSVQRPTGILIFGRPEYRTVTGTVQIVAYVEGVSGSKLQLRISELNFNGDGQAETLNQLDNYNGSSLRVNNIIWDSAYNWRDCP